MSHCVLPSGRREAAESRSAVILLHRVLNQFAKSTFVVEKILWQKRL